MDEAGGAVRKSQFPNPKPQKLGRGVKDNLQYAGSLAGDVKLLGPDAGIDVDLLEEFDHCGMRMVIQGVA